MAQSRLGLELKINIINIRMITPVRLDGTVTAGASIKINIINNKNDNSSTTRWQSHDWG